MKNKKKTEAEKWAEFLEYVKTGSTISRAAAAAGLSIKAVGARLEIDNNFENEVLTTVKKKHKGRVKTEQWDKFLEYVKTGMDKESAAGLAGFSRATFYNRLNNAKNIRAKAEAENNELLDFELDDFDIRFEAALAVFELQHLSNISRAAKGGVFKVIAKDSNGETIKDANGEAKTEDKQIGGNWTASAWLLERRMPAKYGRKFLIPEESENTDKLTAEEIQNILNTAADKTSPFDNVEKIAANTRKALDGLGIYTNLPIIDGRRVKEDD